MSDTLSLSFCGKCGRPVSPGSDFCTGCGNRVKEDPPPEVDAEATPTLHVSDVATFLPSSPSAIRETGFGTSSGPAPRAGDGPFKPGDQVGPRYTIIRLLGAGGMGAVYQAFDHELGVGVAIKVIRPAAQSDA